MENEVKKKSPIFLIIGIIAGLVLLAAIALAVIGVVLFASGSGSRKYDKQLNLGEKYFNEMDYENSILAYENAISIDPKSPEAYLGIVNVYIQTGNKENAEKWAKEGYDATGDSRLAEILESLQEPEEAPRDLLAEGNEALDNMDLELAIKLFDELLKIDPQNIEAYLGIVEAYLRSGDYDKAREWAEIGYEKTGDERIKEKIDMIDSGNISDSEGRQLKMTCYDGEGNVKYFHEYIYEADGNMTTIISYDKDGNETSRVEGMYHNENEDVSYAYYTESGEVFKRVCVYGENGIEKSYSYNIDGTLDDYSLYEYEGDKEIETRYSGDDTPDYRYVTEGNKFSQYYYDGSTWQLTGYQIYNENETLFYDSLGNLEGRMVYGTDENGNRITKEYDAEGNLVRETKYD